MTNNFVKVPEYVYLDSVLLGHANQESMKDVHEVLSEYIICRDKALPYLNRGKINTIPIDELKVLFNQTIKLAVGMESIFVQRHYKTIFVQLALQLGFLIKRLVPNSSHAKFAKSKLDLLSTMDVRLETSLLQPFFTQNIKVLDTPPPVANTSVSSEIVFWDLDEINYVITYLTELGSNFKRFMDTY
ncbi:hypothetical protein [Neobacillus sp. FSL H8-0543]|uniref:hypothetical protein n=1 Tax=Neobacillus sp. FSL H8-0543 TaxID=2954672 RepID=UPI0031586FBE